MQLKEGGLLLSGSEGLAYYGGEHMAAKSRGNWPPGIYSQDEKDECVCSAPFLCAIHSQTLPWWMVPPILRVALLTSVNLI